MNEPAVDERKKGNSKWKPFRRYILKIPNSYERWNMADSNLCICGEIQDKNHLFNYNVIGCYNPENLYIESDEGNKEVLDEVI